MKQQTGMVKKTGLTGVLGFILLFTWGKIYSQDLRQSRDSLDSIPAQHYLTIRHDNDFRIKNFAIDYRQVFESAEFKTVHSHVWGAFTISCRP